MEVDSEKRIILMYAQMHINVGKVNKIKINNLKTTRDFRFIGEEEFKTKVKEILNL
jgi:hypothetical protein